MRQTRASHELQYTRYLTYSDALKYSFFPRTIPVWNTLPASVVSDESTEVFVSYLGYKVRGMRFSMPLIYCL